MIELTLVLNAVNQREGRLTRARRGQMILIAAGIMALSFLQVACEATERPDVEPGDGDRAEDDGINTDNEGTENKTDIDGSTAEEQGSDSESENPCAAPEPPDDLCMLVPSGPACGDGNLDEEEGEECDDGNTVPGDGCTGVCAVETFYECNEPGEACSFLLACGNGIIETGEVCDDGNTDDDDGCNRTCDKQSASFICPNQGEPCERVVFCGDGRILGDETCEDDNDADELESGDGCDTNCEVEEGWICPVPGEPCRPADRCGDGRISPAIGEMCDDGNIEDGDGCMANCQTESGWVCPTPGEPCVDTTRCGDGRVTGREECDDANENPYDGCDDCVVIQGYECPFPGALCIPECGDGLVILNEICDDGNTEDGDGCSSSCEWEDGWACEGPAGSYTCHETICGDEIVEGTEACDDGNNDMGDGCTPFCRLEPECSNGACNSICGDALVLSSVGEVCDDGNNKDGDGCSAACQIEEGYECEQPELGESMEVPLIVRDFSGNHPDFEKGISGSESASLGIVEEELDGDGKPVYAGIDGDGYITSDASFSEWFRDVESNSTVVTTLTLWDNGDEGYVNRYYENGDRWPYYDQETAVWCGAGGSACATACSESEYDVCLDPCTVWGDGNTDACGVRMVPMDGNPLFFPIDDHPDALQPPSPHGDALIPPPYADSWIEEKGSPKHNFSFTSEVLYWFEYNSDQRYSLEFLGDDDVWVFINNRLAVDLGGIHTPVEGGVTLNNASDGAQFGMTDGNVYEIVVFQAERQTNCSSYKLTLSGFNAAKSECGPICGDGVLAPGEACDNGEDNTGGYGECQEDCSLGEYCGDGDVNGPEECDDGLNVSAYNTLEGGCAPNCILPPRCGDGIVQPQFSEECDDGDEGNDGSYGSCNSDCTRGPFCGNGITELEEECDDGANDGTYNTCAPDCLHGPRCGDGIVHSEFGETCDDGNTESGDGCSPICVEEGICGDMLIQDDEECDDGVNDGGYGECGPNCQYGPRCGDGVTQLDDGEECDDGSAEGGVDNNYGGCAPGCVLGPRCGDNVLQPTYEECDDGNDEDGDLCSNACKEYKLVPI